MTKAVLTTKTDPTYDDLPEERYHFPRTYLRQAEAAVGDWIVYYEPRRSSGDPSSRGGRQAYFATARLTAIHADPMRRDYYYALVEDYLELVRPVPFREGALYYESALRRVDGGTNKGHFGRAVRLISDQEYELILRAGYTRLLSDAQAEANTGDVLALAEEPATFERPIVERLVARPFRDVAFAGAVKAAYGETCAFTGIRLINGGGRAEVQAAHIRPVADRGPDSLRNGLALCGTLHWMFDRGLVAVGDDYSLLLAEGLVPGRVRGLINEDRRLRLPARPEAYPHPQFLGYHRETVFKG